MKTETLQNIDSCGISKKGNLLDAKGKKSQKKGPKN